MKNGYLSLNAKTFDIENQEDLILVEASLAKAVSLLNKKVIESTYVVMLTYILPF